MTTNEPDIAAFIAIDWADKKHIYRIHVPGQEKDQLGELQQSPEAIYEWIMGLKKRFNHVPIAIAVEQSRGALVQSLLEYDGLMIYPIHPGMLASFRTAFRPSKSKNDPIDADDILEILLKHRDRLKLLVPDTEETRALDRLTRARRQAVDQRTALVEVLKANLKQYFPQALEILSNNVESELACDLLEKWPTFEKFQHAKPETIRKFLYAHNIRVPAVIDQALNISKTGRPLTTDKAIILSSRVSAQMHARLIQEINKSVDEFEILIKETFDAHPDAYLFNNIPGAGPALAPRLLAAFGSDRSRFESAGAVQAQSGIAPIQRQSGKTSAAFMRHACPKFTRQTYHEFARLTSQKSQWSKNFVEAKTKEGQSYHSAIRALAFKWIRILWKCWQTKTPYNENVYIEGLKKRGSPYAANL